MKYSRANPSARYTDLLGQYHCMHTEGEKFLGLPPERTFPGQSLFAQAGRIKDMILRHHAHSILDYGAGKGMQYQPMPVRIEGVGEWPSIQAFWAVSEIRCYDPCYQPFNSLPSGKFDGVISTDVLEHCPEEDIPWIVDEIFGYAKKFVFANVACYPAKKRLPSGENAHCTIRPPEWWHNILRETSARYPAIDWEVWVQYVVDTAAGNQYAEQRLASAG